MHFAQCFPQNFIASSFQFIQLQPSHLNLSLNPTQPTIISIELQHFPTAILCLISFNLFKNSILDGDDKLVF
jgi:hypothetical protein